MRGFNLDPNSIPCHCSEYDVSFVDHTYKHVLTGDLSLVKNNKLKKLLSKGPKYREPVEIDWMEARNVIEDSLRCLLKIFLM